MGARPFDIGPFGTWAIASRSHPTGQLVGGCGHPQGLGQNGGGHRVGRGHGAHMLPEPVRQQHTRAVGATAEEAGAIGCGSSRGSYGTPGAREVRPVSPPEFAPSRCCRVFGAPDLINFIIERGYMNLRWSISPRSPVQPPHFLVCDLQTQGVAFHTLP